MAIIFAKQETDGYKGKAFLYHSIDIESINNMAGSRNKRRRNVLLANYFSDLYFQWAVWWIDKKNVGVKRLLTTFVMFIPADMLQEKKAGRLFKM